MNLFFTLLGVVIGLYLVYNGARRLFKWIQTGLPGFCRCVFTKARFVIHFVANLIVICRGNQEATGVKQLNRQSVRKCLYALVKRIEQGDRHPLVEQLWQLYVAKIPLHYRETGQERGILDPLPRWMELVGDVCKSPITMMVIKFLALYVVVLFLLPYLSPIALEPLRAAELTLETHLGLTIEPCVWTSNQTLCFMHTHNVLTLHTLQTLSDRTLFFKHKTPNNETQDFLMDEHERLYYPLDFVSPRNQAWRYSIEEESESNDLSNWFTPSPSPIDQEDSLETVQLRRYVNTEQHLAPFLTQLHKEEATTCICALFLNILSNVSFLYDNSEQRWIVMKDVSIYRNNSFAELMASRISFNERSRFFKKHRQWQSLVDEELIHYDSFVVEYTDVSLIEEEVEEELSIKTMRRANDKLREIPYSKASLFKRTGVSIRKQVPISGSEAICFVYCDALQKAYRHKG